MRCQKRKRAAEKRRDHLARFGLPEDGADVIIYTGFGYKGRNVINVRTADIVLIVGGATGTLNEFTIAYDEGKIIGVLEGSGGVTDHIREIVRFCNKPTTGAVFFSHDESRHRADSSLLLFQPKQIVIGEFLQLLVL